MQLREEDSGHIPGIRKGIYRPTDEARWRQVKPGDCRARERGEGVGGAAGFLFHSTKRRSFPR